MTAKTLFFQINSLLGLWISLGCLLVAAHPLAAQVQLSGVVLHLPPQSEEKIVLEYWVGEKWQQITALQLGEGHRFSLPTNAPTSSQCRVRAWNQNQKWNDFVLPAANSGEKNLELNLDFNTMNGTPARVSGSRENDAYFQLLSAQKALQNLRDSLAGKQPEITAAAEKNFSDLCTRISQQYKGSFSGDIVANLLWNPIKGPEEAALSANAFVIKHSLERAPFLDERILYHNGFVKLLHRYYNYFDVRSAEGSQQYLDNIMERRNGNEKVNSFLFSFLMNKMLDQKDENGLTHLLKWYAPDCSDASPVPAYTKNLVEALRHCTPGNTVAELQLKDVQGKNVSLSETCRNQKVTLMLFWRSNCEHCREFEPVLEALYQAYKPYGLEVYAVSIDKNKNDWEKHLAEHPVPWPSVWLSEEEREAFSKHFPTPSTPALIALDAQRKVLSRLLVRHQLEDFLREKLF
jgi:thiol-disulfide isomerase/thioredoxin